MTNSPGGIQAAGNVTVNQAPEPRRLTPLQQEQFARGLNDSPVKGSIVVECYGNVFDSCGLAADFREVLLAANWVPLVFRQTNSSSPLNAPVGLTVRVRNGENPPAHAAVLRTALFSVGFGTDGVVDSKLDEKTIVLAVGAKP